MPDDLSPDAAASFHAAHIDSFRNGTAFSMAMSKWHSQQPQALGNSIPSRVVFAGSILAWTDQQIDCIQLKCLLSRTRVSLLTPRQAKVCQIAISDSTLVAMTLSGRCCAWDLSLGIRNMGGRSPRCIETHARQTEFLVVSAMTVVVVHDSSEETVNFTTWDIENRQSHHFRIKINRGAFPDTYDYFAIISPGEKSVVLFERLLCQTNYARFTRTDLKGRIESSRRMEHPDIDDYSRHSEYAAPVCTAGCVTLWSYAASREMRQTTDSTWEVMRVVYDTRADRLELQRHAVEHWIPTRLSKTDFFWWKDVAYIGNYANRHEDLEVLDLKASVCKTAEMSASVLVPKPLESQGFDMDYGWRSGFFLGNESFLISVRYVRRLNYMIGGCTSSGTAIEYAY